MARTESIIILVIILFLGNFFIGSLVVNNDDEYILDELNPLTSVKSNLEFKKDQIENDQREKGFLQSLADVGTGLISFPVIILDFLLDMIIILGVGFASVPVILNTIVIAPLVVMAFLEYFLPMLRGN